MGCRCKVALLNCVLIAALLLLAGCREESVTHRFEVGKGTDWDSGIGVRVSVPPSSAKGRAELVVKKLVPKEAGEGAMSLHSVYDISFTPRGTPQDYPLMTLSFEIPEGVDPQSVMILEWVDEGWLPARSKGGLPGGEVSPDGKYISILREHLSKFAVAEWVLGKLLEALEKIPEIPPCPKIEQGKSEWPGPNRIAVEVTVESPNLINWEFPDIGRLGIGGTWYEVKVEHEEHVEVKGSILWLAPGDRRELELIFPATGEKARVCLDAPGAISRAGLNWASRLGLPVSELDTLLKIIEDARARHAEFKDLIRAVKEMLLYAFWKKAGAWAKFAANLIPVSVEIGIYITTITISNYSHYCRDIAPEVKTPLAAPTALRATAISPTEIKLNWAPATDPARVVGYRIYRDGVEVGAVSQTSYSDTGLSPSTTYCYAVSAYDAAGNESARSSEACAATLTESPMPSAGILGIYICRKSGLRERQAEIGTLGLTEEGHHLELRADGAAIFLDPWPLSPGMLTGRWTLDGSEIEVVLTFMEMVGIAPSLKGRIEGETITFADGSVWTKTPPPPPGPEVSQVIGIYVCNKATEAEPRFMSLVFEKGYLLKLAEDGVLELTDPEGGPTVAGEWRLDGERITLVFSLFDLLIRREGKAGQGTITLEDGSIWIARPYPANKPPHIDSLIANPTAVQPGGQVRIIVSAHDPEDDPLTFTWSATSGALSGTTGVEEKVWIAPKAPGIYKVTVTVSDNQPGHAPVAQSVDIRVVEKLEGPITSSEKIAFVSAGYNIHLINPDGTDEVRLAELPEMKLPMPIWSPDGQKIAYKVADGSDEDGLYVINRDGTSKIRVAEDFYIEGVNWSPDGTRIAFARSAFEYPHSQPGIYLVDADGTDLVRLSEESSVDVCFSPNGERIAYIGISSADESYYLYIINADGTGKIKLAPVSIHQILPSGLTWSQRDLIAYVDQAANLAVVTPSPSAKPMVLDRDAGYPSWSPDGGKIAYIKPVFGEASLRPSLFIANPDGTGKAQLMEFAADPFNLWAPSWSPDGGRIVFSTGERIYIVSLDGTGRVELAYGLAPQWLPAQVYSANFSLTVAPNSVSIRQGEARQVRVNVIRTGGFTDAIDLALEGAPSGVIWNFDPARASGDSSVLTLQLAQSVAPGRYSLSVRGKSSKLEKTSKLTLSIEPAESPAECMVTVQPGESIQGVIGRAPDGTVICLPPGTWEENVKIEKSLTLRGAGQERTIIKGALGGYPVIWIPSTSWGVIKIEELEIAGAWGECAEDGSGIHSDGMLVQEVAPPAGGWTFLPSICAHGMLIQGPAQVRITGSVVAGNELAGLVVSNSAKVNLINSVVSDNGGPGLIAGNLAVVTIEQATIERNGTLPECSEDISCSGVLVVEKAKTTIIDSKILNNTGWGVAAWLEKCGYDENLFEGRVEFQGTNVIEGNGRGQICLPEVTPSAGNKPPVVSITSPINKATLASKAVEFKGTAVDPEGKALTYAWDFGDGKGRSTEQNPRYVYEKPGTYTVTLTVTDDKGARGTAKITITVKNAMPVARATASPIRGNAPLTVQFSSSGTADPDSPAANLSYEWDFGDGVGKSAQPNPGYQYQKPGIYTATLIVTDSDGATAQATLTITVEAGSPEKEEALLTRIGYVAVGDLLREYKGATTAAQQFSEERDKKEKELQELAERLQAGEITQEEYQRRVEEIQRELQQLDLQLTAKVQQELLEAIAEIARENDFTWITKKDVVLFATSEAMSDLTLAVLGRLNAKYAGLETPGQDVKVPVRSSKRVGYVDEEKVSSNYKGPAETIRQAIMDAAEEYGLDWVIRKKDVVLYAHPGAFADLTDTVLAKLLSGTETGPRVPLQTPSREIRRVAYVNAEEVFLKYKGTVMAVQQFSAEKARKEQELQQLMEQLNAGKITEAEYQQKVDEIRQYLQQLDAELTAKVQQEILSVITAVGQARGYDWVTRKKDVMLFLKPGLADDITNLTIETLNERFTADQAVP